MIKRFRWYLVVLTTLSFCVLWASPALRAQPAYHGGSLTPQQHGYEHGYRDGYEAQRGSRLSNRDQDIRNQQRSAHGNGYEPAFGSEAEYSEGYKEGIRDGAADARNGVASRLEQLF